MTETGPRILLIEDDDLMLNMLEDNLGRAGFSTTPAVDGIEGVEKFKKNDFELVILDLKLPKLDGISVLKRIKEASPETVCIIMTGYGTVETAVQAMKLGAFDYLTKPFLVEEMLLLIRNGLELQSLKKENMILKNRLGPSGSLVNIIGKSRVMENVFRLIESVAQYNTTVLVQGENGTGKELAAEAIHKLSPRKDGPLIKINCSALPEALLESELFGHEKGAFTDAIRKKIGRFELADGGTIFLDDIDDMKLSAQVKLLRVIQQREFERVGGTETIKTDVRIISATKADLRERIKEGSFREDLYYRLNVVQINLPPLRERSEDIPALAAHFLRKFNNSTKKETELEPAVLQAMGRYYWPGNIRELENLIERLVSLAANKEIKTSELPTYFLEKNFWKESSLDSVVRKAEKEHILLSLEHSGGVKKKAAEILGISAKTLWEKSKEYGID